MPTLFDDLVQITDPETNADVRRLAMRDFAEQLRWTPNYELSASLGVPGAGDHVIVEHGLSNSAVISFLRGSVRAGELDNTQVRALLSISYNNLVDWHILVSQGDVRRINNLVDSSTDSSADIWEAIQPSTFLKRLSSDAFSAFNGLEAARKTLRACDDALIAVISRWKRLLKADYPAATNEALSTLFNSLIFVRGCEDRRLDLGLQSGRLLQRITSREQAEHIDVRQLVVDAFAQTNVAGNLADYVDLNKLAPFSELDRYTAQDLVRDFYAPKEAPYDFNFAFMSKHALSRIYERYVSLLVPDEQDGAQLAFIRSVPSEKAPTRTGAVYTPQFIASFFARYIRDHTTPRRFRAIQSLDPACGSGIFLRSLLELQCNPLDPGITKASIAALFAQAVGYDKDANATEATRLSLALLHLVATNELPRSLSIHTADAIAQSEQGALLAGEFGAVITNPPYIKLDHLPLDDRELHKRYLGQEFKGQLDAYLSFVRLSLASLEPDGIACMVLPQAFLTARNALTLRRQIADGFDVRCLIDLSAVDVFEGVGAYSILLIAQRRVTGANRADTAFIGQASEFVGTVLQAVLDSRSVSSPYYRVFEVGQDFFKAREWIIVGPEAMVLDRQLRTLPRLGDYLDCFQGFVTGADDVFIRPRGEVPEGETSIYMDYLPDRLIGRFSLPARVPQVLFYPYLRDQLISEEQLRELFPGTWAYLEGNREQLSRRRRSASTPWWKPERPREPSRMKRPKVVCPHLMLTPRFAIDIKGRYAVSHGPAMIARDRQEEQTLLPLFCGILNSGVANWYLRTYVPSYSKGYSRVEPATLRDMPVPDLTQISPGKMDRFLDLVRRSDKDGQTEAEIDELVADFYNLGSHERAIVGRLS